MAVATKSRRKVGIPDVAAMPFLAEGLSTAAVGSKVWVQGDNAVLMSEVARISGRTIVLRDGSWWTSKGAVSDGDPSPRAWQKRRSYRAYTVTNEAAAEAAFNIAKRRLEISERRAAVLTWIQTYGIPDDYVDAIYNLYRPKESQG